ncbi:hypothetical protein AWB71_00675 [Caballeronia peredens]|nr:hypothetical protein AWB71_00675 [Caballeronia peredens]
MKNQYFPALLVGEFLNARDALASIGVDDDTAKVLIAEANEAYVEGCAYSAELADLEGDETNAVLVLDAIDGGVTRLCIGYPGLAAESKDAALMLASIGLLPYLVDNDLRAPVLHAYRLAIVRRTLH